MFTGLIETMGAVAHLQKLPGGARLTIRVPQIAGQLELGDSIAVNGCCVTVVEQDDTSFTADLVPESLARTNLGVLAIGSEVNIERAMAVGDRFGGHWVQGHVDCLGQVRSRKRVGNEELLEITVPFEITRYIVAQGSITLDGVSLTVVDCGKDRFRVALIPHTRELTTLGHVQPMDVVNVELDVLAKYLEKHVAAFAQRLPRMLREATAAQAASAPLTRDIPLPNTSEPAPAPTPLKRSVAASHASATTATVKRDRPKVRRSAQATPVKKRVAATKAKSKSKSSGKAKAKVKSRAATTTRRPAPSAKRTAASAKPRRASTSARTATRKPAAAKKSTGRKTAAKRSGRR